MALIISSMTTTIRAVSSPAEPVNAPPYLAQGDPWWTTVCDLRNVNNTNKLVKTWMFYEYDWSNGLCSPDLGGMSLHRESRVPMFGFPLAPILFCEPWKPVDNLVIG